MSISPVQTTSNSVTRQIASSLFKEIASAYPSSGFAVKFWDGKVLALSADPRFTIVFRSPQAVHALLVSPDELTLGEFYISGDLDVEGDMEEALRFADFLLSYQPQNTLHLVFQKLATALSTVRSAIAHNADGITGELHSRDRDRAAIAHHYDVSNDFYRLWLDTQLLYTEAYFKSSDESLDTAQARKLDYLCQKMNLHPGEKLLDIGCGWGGLLLHAASHYGVEAHGITLSERQAELARERIQSAGLSDRCSVQICDYRDVAGSNRYNKICSIGMIEHVGAANLGAYFAGAWRLLCDGGLFLNSGIAASATWQRQGESFMDHYVFPDGDLVPLHVTIREAEMSGFEVRDVDCLREHYALTLDHWVHRLEAHQAEAKLATDEATYRIWKLYMAGSAHGFRTGRINLYQILLSKSDEGKCRLPLTRQDWFKDRLAA